MKKKKQQEIIFDRMAALLALLLAAAYDYGPRILLLFLTAAAVSLLTEYCCVKIRSQRFCKANLDAVVCGTVLLLMMPPTVPFSLLIMSCIFAIIIGRALFGGMENPVISPSAAGYCFAMLNNRAAMTAFPAVGSHLPLLIPESLETAAGLSPAWNRAGTFPDSALQWVTTLPRQPMGSLSFVILAAAAIVLMLRRSASAPVIIPCLSIAITTEFLMSNMQSPLLSVIGCCMTNQFLFAAVFLFGDPQFAPPHLGGTVAGMGAGILTVVFSRFLYVYDAPVLLTVLLSPLMLWLCRLIASAEQSEGGRSRNEIRIEKNAH